MSKPKPGKYITEHIFELRHEASGKFMDLRGRIADYVKENNFCKHWAIGENTISFFDEDGTINKPRAIISFNKIAVVIRNPSTMNYFQDQALAFLKIIERFNEYKIPKIQRFGARTKCYIPVNEKLFDNVYKKMCEKLFNKTALSEIGGSSTDLQVVLDFKDKPYNGRTILGPVKENEATRYFSFRSKEFCSSGVYVDVDYFQNNKIALKEVRSLLSKAMQLTWDKIDKTASTLEV